MLDLVLTAAFKKKILLQNLLIFQCHLEGLADESQKGKVVFFVPTVELVEQQSNMYRRYLDQYQIVNMSGDVQVYEINYIST